MVTLSIQHLGPVLKNKRGSRGLREVAEEIGTSPATLSRIETGKQPDLDTFTKICKWLEISPSEILGFEPSPISSQSFMGSPLVSVPSAHFRAPKAMSEKTISSLATLISSAQSYLLQNQAQ